MATSYTEHFSTKKTPQTEAIPGRETEMVKNSAGGVTFKVDKWAQFDRFLILGCEGGTYYTSERSLTKENAKNTIECIKADGLRVVKTIVEVSDSGRAPKNDPAIFALALCTAFGDEDTKKAAYDAISKVCRIGTHVFQFCENIQALRGWSSGLRKGVAKYYDNQNADHLAYHLIKYQNRNGWSHRDVMRLAHPKPANKQIENLFKWAVGKEMSLEELHPQVKAFEELKKTEKKDVSSAVSIIKGNSLPREAVPTEFLNDKKVWESMLYGMPVAAMVRNLGKMTSIGLLDSNLSDATKHVVATLTNKEILKKSRIHPMAILLAAKVYENGRGVKGSLNWSPVAKINDALSDSFYAAFDNVEPTNQNWLLALDVSGSMGSPILNNPISAREAVCAMALITAKTEQNHEIMGFSNHFMRLGISPKQRLQDAVRVVERLPFSSTDCSLPMLYALEKNLKVDTFAVYTDSETYAGKMQPVQALDKYRQKTGIPAKLVVLATSSTGFTIADPKDKGMLDVVGLDASVPQVIRDFSIQK